MYSSFGVGKFQTYAAVWLQLTKFDLSQSRYECDKSITYFASTTLLVE